MPTTSTASSSEARKVAAIRRALVAWFRRGHRAMPWRETRDPYAIWVSEIMLQQTRVETVRAYYQRWMARLPTVRALAEAQLDDVLSLWSGLGYYARARNLKKAAEVLVAEDGGVIPVDAERLRALPGVGAYTAGAIASIAFGLPEPILDGNVARILSRLFLIDGPIEGKATRDRLWALARLLVPGAAPGDLNQAMMELGAVVCTPRDPACDRCPVATRCDALREGRVAELPRKKTKKAVPLVEQHALMMRDAADRARVLLAQRPARGLWGGLWEPPCVEVRAGETMAATLARAGDRFGVRLSGVVTLPAFTHELTHRRYHFHPFGGRARGRPVDLDGAYDAVRWVPERELAGLGLSAWARRLLEMPDER